MSDEYDSFAAAIAAVLRGHEILEEIEEIEPVPETVRVPPSTKLLDSCKESS